MDTGPLFTNKVFLVMVSQVCHKRQCLLALNEVTRHHRSQEVMFSCLQCIHFINIIYCYNSPNSGSLRLSEVAVSSLSVGPLKDSQAKLS